MTRHVASFGFVLATLAVRGVLGQAPADHNRFEQRWPFDSAGSVRIVNAAGRIRVIGWDVDSLSVSGRGPGRLAAAGTASVRKLVVTGRAELEVHVPRGARVWVKSASADIDVVGVDGTLDLNSVGGAIHVVGTPVDVEAETMSGPVELAGGSGRARVKTVSGDILLRGASVDLGASTLSGTIVVRAAGWQRGGTGVQRGRFESVTGDVRFDGELGRGGIVEFESQSGAIALRVPRTTVADFDLLTIGGSVTNHLTADVADRGTLRCSTGAGGAQVTARSFKGSISLEAK
jgi:Putative adhesin